MARKDDLKDNIVQQSGRLVFIQSISYTTTASETDLNATCADGTPVPPDALLAVQPSTDVWFRPCAKGATAGASSTNSRRVLQWDEHRQHLRGSASGGSSGNIPADGGLDVAGVSASGVLNVFLVT